MIRTESGRFVKGIHAYRPPQPHWEAAWLEREYVQNQRSAGDIAAEIQCTEANIFYWLRKHGIARRTISEARSIKHWGASGAMNPMFGRIGNLNPRYVDGSSPERQRLYASAAWKALVIRVYERDGYRCRKCDLPRTRRRRLHAHHIKSWAAHPELRMSEENLISLCVGCHRWVHSRSNSKKEFIG